MADMKIFLIEFRNLALRNKKLTAMIISAIAVAAHISVDPETLDTVLTLLAVLG